MDVAIGPFPADALPANRSGRLTETQRHNLGNYEGSRQQSTRRFALIPLAIAAIILFAPGLKASALVHYGVPFICIVVAIVLVVWSSSGSDRVARDLREGRVASFEGPVNKRGSMTLNSNTAPTRYLLDVGGKRFNVSRDTFDALPDGREIRVYYLPRSNHVVNLERPPNDTAIEDQNLSTSAGTIGAQPFAQNDHGTSGSDPFAQDILGSPGLDPFAQDRLAGINLQDNTQATADPIEERFNRHSPFPAETVSETSSLASAIVGTWRSPMMTVTFRADGAVTGMTRNGMQRTGHWSVGADGSLQSDVMGMNQSVDARIRGDQFEILLGGVALTFDRVTS